MKGLCGLLLSMSLALAPCAASASRWSLELDGEARDPDSRAPARVGLLECRAGRPVHRGGVSWRSLTCSVAGREVHRSQVACGTGREVRISVDGEEHVVSLGCRLPPTPRMR